MSRKQEEQSQAAGHEMLVDMPASLSIYSQNAFGAKCGCEQNLRKT